MALLTLLLVSPSAWAGTYVWSTTNPTAQSPAFSGGMVACTNNGSSDNTDGHSGYSGTTYSYGADFKPTNGSISCSGSISATFTWQAAYTGEMPPASAILTETCSAQANAISQSTPGAASDGFGDSISTLGTVSHTYYSGVSAGETVTGPSRSPSASVSYPGHEEIWAGVTYTASATPVTINPSGATSDGNGGWDILVGQHCAPTLQGVPSALLNNTANPPTYSWTVTGTPFQSWTVSADHSQATLMSGPGATNVASPSWYWTELNQTTETITCTVTLTPPAGEGSAFSLTVTQKVTVMVPFVQASGTAGYMSVPQGGNVFYLNASPRTASYRGGMDFDAVVMTPTSPAFGDGKIEMVQIAIPNESYVVYSTGANDPDPENNHTGIDTGYPYGNTPQNPSGGVVVTEPMEFQTQDSPHLLLQNGNTPIASSATMMHQFQGTLMYQPPNGQWVPVATFSWSTNGSATIPATHNWGNYPAGQSPPYYGAGTVSPTGLFTLSDQYPTWVAIDKFPTF